MRLLRRSPAACLPAGRLLLAVTTLLVSSVALALEIPDRPAAYVNDYAGLLSQAARERLERKLAAFEEATSNQVVVAIFPSLEGEALEDFSIRLAEKWKVGQKGRDNGVILLIFKNDRKLRIEVGYGLEGALPDALASHIITDEIVPAFKRGDFDKGVEAGIGAILAATRGEYEALSHSREDSAQQKASVAFVLMMLYFLVPIVCYFGLLVFGFGYFGAAGFGGALLLTLVLILLRSAFFGQTLSGLGGWWGPVSGGSGWGGGFSAGGGFGGGGGSFGGGGAGGSW